MVETKNPDLTSSYQNVASEAGDILLVVTKDSHGQYVLTNSATPPADTLAGFPIGFKEKGPTMLAGEHLHVKGAGTLVIAGTNLVI